VPVFAREAGMLRSVNVKKGEEVDADDVVAQIDDIDARLAAETAEYQYYSDKEKAENRLTVEFAELSTGVAKQEWEAAKEANRKVPGTFSIFEVRRLELTYHRSGIQKKLEEHNLVVARWDALARLSQHKQALAMIERRQLTAPHDGVVVSVDRKKGYWVTAGEPVIQLVRMDRLEVEGRVPVRRFRYSEVKNQKAKVIVKIGGETSGLTSPTVEIDTRISFASPLIEEDGAFRISAEIPNEKKPDGSWLLEPGRSATIVLQGK
jgi:multidrug efflux pump subunit AcrA (membrane-fusion protein)